MLRSLHMTNFRRHVDTHLTFTPDSQVIAITGANGAGKTTILEALTYALYGESRHGRRNLARLVRRGAEFEGMQVELSFTVGDVDYDLVRRYERGKTSATLMANSNLIMQSADGVTAEVTRILGMDSAGFRLAVIAQQFEIDGLADMTPTRRRQTVTRLLRLDAITKARGAANDEKLRQLDVVKALGSGPDLDALAKDVQVAVEELEAAKSAEADCAEALAELDRKLGAMSGALERWQQAQVAYAAAQATVTAHRAQVDQLEAELAGIRVPDEPSAPQVPLPRIVAELSQVAIAIANAEANAELARTAEQTRGELERVQVALAQVAERLGGDTPATVAMARVQAQADLDAAAEADQEARSAHQAAIAERARVAADLEALRARARAEAELGDTCDTCGQAITAEHKHRQAAARKAAEADLVAALSAADAALQAAAGRAQQAAQDLADARGRRDGLAARAQLVASLMEERKELTRRKETYAARLERIKVVDVDLDGLLVRRGELELAKAAAEQYEAQVAARQGALERAERVSAALEQARERVRAAQKALEDAEPGADLVAEHEAVVAAQQARDAEAELLSELRVQVAAAAERVTAAQRALEGARAQSERLREVRAGADRAAKTARLLEVVADRMATQIRPALEGAISDALARLSEGRFTAVRLSDSYDISVYDDDDFQPLSELSGGERVLVALATRLALAEVVAGRHVDGGLRVLVLDEVFGSQDAQRREAIMSALRSLRAQYGQILLISHVGGMEDEADHVIEVSARTLDGVRVAEALAA